jgi:hypothetical protein
MKTNRRHFLTTLGVTASATLLGPSLFDFRLLAGPPFVRPDVGGLGESGPILTGYSTAIAAMQALPITDPRSWAYQAAIHGTTASPLKADWNTCQHGTPFFWAWHRMYLYWFERIVRSLSGDSNWALPYWNWTSETKLPAPFRNTSSNLYTPNRDPNINNGTGSLPASDVAYKLPLSNDFSNLDYYTAQGALEGSPHAAVHVDVGGWMSSVPTAAMDPIFYLHHANIDRLWDLWLAQGGGRSDPTSDTTWTTKVFHFFDENKNPVSMTPCDVLVAATQLNYEYQGEPLPQVFQTCGTIPPWVFRYFVLLNIPFPPVPIGPDPYLVPADISKVQQQLVNILKNPMQQVFLELDGVQTKTQPEATWEVYVGLPAGVPPDPSSPFYVGKLALFGRGVQSDSHHSSPATLRFNATKALAAVVNSGSTNAQLSFFCKGIVVNGQQLPGNPRSPVTVASGLFRVQTRSRR